MCTKDNQHLLKKKKKKRKKKRKKSHLRNPTQTKITSSWESYLKLSLSKCVEVVPNNVSIKVPNSFVNSTSGYSHKYKNIFTLKRYLRTFLTNESKTTVVSSQMHIKIEISMKNWPTALNTIRKQRQNTNNILLQLFVALRQQRWKWCSTKKWNFVNTTKTQLHIICLCRK